MISRNNYRSYRRRLALLLVIACGFISFNARSQPFVHPASLHTVVDLNRMKTNVLAGNHPWIDDWNILITDSQSQSNYSEHVNANMGSSRQNADLDAHAAYLNFIRWYISGDANYANKAAKICNDWSAAVNQVPSGTDTPGLIGIPIAHFAEVGELLRAYSGWTNANYQAFTNMMVQYLYPSCNSFLTSHNGACISSYWANWDACNIEALIAMGVLCDNTNIYNQGVNYFESGAGNGSISNAVPYLYNGGALGQWQESGRDQEHAQLGIGELGNACQIAWNQGLDLFAFGNNRLLAGAEYAAQYNLAHAVPYTFYNNCAGANQFWLAINGRGRLDDRPVWELIYNHYFVLQGLPAPNSKAMAQLMRPEHGSVDHFGYGTLTFTLNATNSPYPPAPIPQAPSGLTATPGVSQVYLNWTSPAGDMAQGYAVLRATTSGGPYTNIASWNANTLPQYTDTGVASGTTYYYVVAAIDQAGTSANSSEVSATPMAAGSLPVGWTNQDIGTVTSAGSASYSLLGNGTFIVAGSGSGIGGTSDSFQYAYRAVTNNFTIIVRLSSLAAKFGLMMRETLNTNAIAVTLTLGDTGDRESRFGTRSSTGGNMTWVTGDDYTWVPVWYRLQRVANTFTASHSSDGLNWYTVGSSTVSMAATYYVGFPVVSGTAVFDNESETGAQTPSAPSGLTATAVSSGQINLSWSPVTNGVAYNVKRSGVSNGSFTNIATAVSSTSYFDTTVNSNTTYYYVVSAITGFLESTNSAQALATTPLPSPPSAPTGLTANVGSSSVTLNWTASLGATSYNVKRATVTGGPYTTIATGVAGNYVDTNAVKGADYFYVVSAVNAGGESGNSAEVAVLLSNPLRAYLKFDEASGTIASDSASNGWNGTLVNAPTWVAGYSNNCVNLSSNSSQYVTLSNGVVNGLTDFTIAAWVKQTTASTWARVFDFGNNTTVYMFLAPRATSTTGTIRFAITTGSTGGEQQINGTSALPTGAWHHVAVTLAGTKGVLYVDGVAVGTNSSMTLNPSSLGSTALNYIGKSQWPDPYYNGQVDEFRIYNAALGANEVYTFVTPLPAPTGLAATAGNAQVTLNWNASARANGYNIKRSTTNGGPYTVVAANVTGLTYTDNNLANGTTYYYIVSAENTVGESTNSVQAGAQPVAPPAAPATLTATPSDTRVYLSWSASTGANGYNLKSAVDSGGPYTLLATNMTSLVFTNNGLINGEIYYYVVSAVNSAGEGNNSDEAVAQPVSMTPPQAVIALAGNQLQLSWPLDHTGWSLQVQTNPLSAGITTNWVTIPESKVTNFVSIPVAITNGSVFYRLVSP